VPVPVVTIKEKTVRSFGAQIRDTWCADLVGSAVCCKAPAPACAEIGMPEAIYVTFSGLPPVLRDGAVDFATTETTGSGTHPAHCGYGYPGQTYRYSAAYQWAFNCIENRSYRLKLWTAAAAEPGGFPGQYTYILDDSVPILGGTLMAGDLSTGVTTTYSNFASVLDTAAVNINAPFLQTAAGAGGAYINLTTGQPELFTGVLRWHGSAYGLDDYALMASPAPYQWFVPCDVDQVYANAWGVGSQAGVGYLYNGGPMWEKTSKMEMVGSALPNAGQGGGVNFTCPGSPSNYANHVPYDWYIPAFQRPVPAQYLIPPCTAGTQYSLPSVSNSHSFKVYRQIIVQVACTPTCNPDTTAYPAPAVGVCARVSVVTYVVDSHSFDQQGRAIENWQYWAAQMDPDPPLSGPYYIGAGVKRVFTFPWLGKAPYSDRPAYAVFGQGNMASACNAGFGVAVPGAGPLLCPRRPADPFYAVGFVRETFPNTGAAAGKVEITA
jgi:hypothetical protein